MPDPIGGRILLTNDDGVAATGLGVAEKIARELTDDVWVCAPEGEQSAASHSLTLNRPLRLRELGDKRFAVDGTPTDCVLLAVKHLLKDRPPDLVLSGVNRGVNAAEDVTYSGTIAGAMEATLLGIRAMALSQMIAEGGPVDWSGGERWGAEVVRRAVSVDWPTKVLVNVNFPPFPADEVKGVEVARHGHLKFGDQLDERVDPRGRTYYWIGMTVGGEPDRAGTDTHALYNAFISVTPLYLDLTHYPTMDTLRQVFS
jgi:5'-nucleotidase